MDDDSLIRISTERRTELKKFKAEYDETYDEAIERLLECYGYYNE